MEITTANQALHVAIPRFDCIAREDLKPYPLDSDSIRHLQSKLALAQRELPTLDPVNVDSIKRHVLDFLKQRLRKDTLAQARRKRNVLKKHQDAGNDFEIDSAGFHKILHDLPKCDGADSAFEELVAFAKDGRILYELLPNDSDELGALVKDLRDGPEATEKAMEQSKETLHYTIGLLVFRRYYEEMIPKLEEKIEKISSAGFELPSEDLDLENGGTTSFLQSSSLIDNNDKNGPVSAAESMAGDEKRETDEERTAENVSEESAAPAAHQNEHDGAPMLERASSQRELPRLESPIDYGNGECMESLHSSPSLALDRPSLFPGLTFMGKPLHTFIQTEQQKAISKAGLRKKNKTSPPSLDVKTTEPAAEANERFSSPSKRKIIRKLPVPGSEEFTNLQKGIHANQKLFLGDPKSDGRYQYKGSSGVSEAGVGFNFLIQKTTLEPVVKIDLSKKSAREAVSRASLETELGEEHLTASIMPIKIEVSCMIHDAKAIGKVTLSSPTYRHVLSASLAMCEEFEGWYGRAEPYRWTKYEKKDFAERFLGVSRMSGLPVFRHCHVGKQGEGDTVQGTGMTAASEVGAVNRVLKSRKRTVTGAVMKTAKARNVNAVTTEMEVCSMTQTTDTFESASNTEAKESASEEPNHEQSATKEIENGGNMAVMEWELEEDEQGEDGDPKKHSLTDHGQMEDVKQGDMQDSPLDQSIDSAERAPSAGEKQSEVRPKHLIENKFSEQTGTWSKEKSTSEKSLLQYARKTVDQGTKSKHDPVVAEMETSVKPAMRDKAAGDVKELEGTGKETRAQDKTGLSPSVIVALGCMGTVLVVAVFFLILQFVV